MHECLGVRRVWQEHVQSMTCNRLAQMAASVRRLVRVGKAGNELPEIGQTCLVLCGDETKDVGQEAVMTQQRQEVVVTKHATARVHITYPDRNGRQATRLKHPASLVLLEDGLHLLQDARGFVWIKGDPKVD
jgi:hypothetical protein